MAGSTGQETTDADKRKTLGKIINDASAAFLVTRRPGDGLHGRPMATARVDEDITAIWFSCDRNSPKVEEIRADPRVYLGYTDHTGSEWASINGRASIVDDRAKIKELWSPAWKNWFDGPDDPKIILIKVNAEDAEYWDNGSRMLMVAKMGISAVTGAKFNDGENAKLHVGQ